MNSYSASQQVTSGLMPSHTEWEGKEENWIRARSSNREMKTHKRCADGTKVSILNFHARYSLNDAMIKRMDQRACGANVNYCLLNIPFLIPFE